MKPETATQDKAEGATASARDDRPAGTAELTSGVCWIDLGTPDVEAAAAFYAALLGWHVAPADPTDPTGYRLASLHGHLVAAFGPSEEPGPPYWTIYTAIPDAATTTRAATVAGGTVVVQPTPAGDAGVSAVVHGPHGLPLSLWQAGTHSGTWTSRLHGTLADVQLRTEQPTAHADFLRAVLDWHLHGDDFTHRGETVASRVSPTSTHPTASPWLVRFHVDDIDDALQRAVSLGAHQLDGEPATLLDPTGALLSLVSTARPVR